VARDKKRQTREVHERYDVARVNAGAKSGARMKVEDEVRWRR